MLLTYFIALETWRSHSGDAEDSGPLACDVASLAEWLQSFRGITGPSSSIAQQSKKNSTM